MAAMTTDAAHTRIVRGARIVLPVLALGLLSTLFLLARTVDPDAALPFAQVDVSMRARDQQLTAPRFAGVSRDGTRFALAADRALPDAADPRLLSAEALTLALTAPDGAQTTLAAGRGIVDTGRRDIVLDETVRIATSAGYVLTAPRLEGSLMRLDMRATGGVAGDGPLGRMRAGAMRLTEDANGAQRMLFTGGVDLLYAPPDP